MNAFDEFIMSDAFFPVIIVLLVLLIAIFIIITVNNHRKYGPVKNLKKNMNQEIDYSNEIHIINTDDLSKTEIVSNDVFAEIFKGENLETNEKPKQVFEQQPTVTQQSVVSTSNEVTRQIVEQAPDAGQEQNVEAQPKTNFSESVSIDDKKIADDLDSLNQMAWNAFENPNADVETRTEEQQSAMDLPTKSVQNKPELEIPIQQNSNVEENNKFMSDVHDFPDFSTIEKEEPKQHENSRIEEDVIDAANRYIESIMSGNK